MSADPLDRHDVQRRSQADVAEPPVLLRVIPDENKRRTASQTGIPKLTHAVVDEDDHRYREGKGGYGDTYAHAFTAGPLSGRMADSCVCCFGWRWPGLASRGESRSGVRPRRWLSIDRARRVRG